MMMAPLLSLMPHGAATTSTSIGLVLKSMWNNQASNVGLVNHA